MKPPVGYNSRVKVEDCGFVTIPADTKITLFSDIADPIGTITGYRIQRASHTAKVIGGMFREDSSGIRRLSHVFWKTRGGYASMVVHRHTYLY